MKMMITCEVGTILVVAVGSMPLVVEDTLEVVVVHNTVAFLLVADIR